MVYIILGKGFEETEAIAPLDILRRGGVYAVFAGIGGKTVSSAHGIEIGCDILSDDIDLDKADMIVIPGGLEGVKSIKSDKAVMDKIKTAHDRGTALAAICAGPTVLYDAGVLNGVNITCYPGMESEMPNAEVDISKAVCIGGKIITGRGPGAALEFGFALLRYLKGADIEEKVKEAMIFR